MQIGIDASRAARARHTGTETYAFQLIKALAPLTASRHRLRLYTSHPPHPPDWPEAAHIETRLIPCPRLWTHLRLALELHQHPPDLLFVPAHVLPFYCPVPALVTVHDLGYRHYPQAHRLFDRLYLEWSTRRHSRVARHIIADSQATKEDLIHYYQADPARISVIHLGRDETLKPITNPDIIAQTKRQYNISGDYLLYLGTLHPRKNLPRLIDAFHHFSQSNANHDLSLVIAGKQGWLYAEIFEQVRRLDLTGRIIFPGYVSNQAKPALLSGATAYLFPSLYEGFGLPILEAMACGVPVLTGNRSSLPEVAGQAALMVDPLNTAQIAAGITQLVNDGDLRQRLIRAGYRQIENFSWQKTARQLLDLFEKIAYNL